MLIYKITNKINGKIYIGQTIQTLVDRISNHLADSKRDRIKRVKSKLHRAISKYGITNFVFEVLDTADSQDELNQKEQKYVTEFKSNVDTIGYNLLSGGKQNGKHSRESLEKMKASSLKMLKKRKDEGIAHWNKGRLSTPESNEKRRQKILGVKCPQRGNTYSLEKRKQISERMILVRKARFWSTNKKVTSV